MADDTGHVEVRPNSALGLASTTNLDGRISTGKLSRLAAEALRISSRYEEDLRASRLFTPVSPRHRVDHVDLRKAS